MKGFSTLILAAVALSASAAQPEILTNPFGPQELTLKNVSLTKATSLMQKAPAKEESETPAPAVLAGRSFITFYNDINIQCNGYFTAEGTNDDLTLKGFAYGYDVKGSYNPETGTITIPTGVVIGSHSTYGNITIHAFNWDNGGRDSSPIIATWNGNGFSFNWSLIGSVQAGDLIIMGKISATAANGTLTMMQLPNSFSTPLLVEKTDDNTLSVVGVSNLLYGAYAPLPFTLNQAAGTATLPFGTVTDKQYTQTGYVDWYLGGKNPIGQITNLEATVTTTETTSLLECASAVLVCREGSSYSGYSFTNFTINVNFNVYTGEAGDDTGDQDTDTPVIGDIEYLLNRTNMTASVTGCLATVTDLNIPAQIEVESGVYTVNDIAEGAFMANRKITSITLPSTIQTVGTDAFRNVSNLKTLKIADLTAWCGITFANGNANPLYNVFPTSTSKWGKVYFNGEEVTGELVIPEGVEVIGRSFYGFKSLTSVSLPASLTGIGDQAFASCIGLTEVTIPANVETVGSLFYGCENLKKVTFEGNALTSLGGSFNGCKALEEVNIPEGVKSIGGMCFYSCKSLKTLSFPSTLESLGLMALDGCSGLESLECLAIVPPTAGMWAFDDINTEIPVYVPESSIESYKEAEEWKDFTNFLPAVTGIEGVEMQAAPAEYYNLQGIRVAEPKEGAIYILRQGNKTSKVIF